MALNRIHLRKLLKIIFLDANARRSAIREDIRNDIASEAARAAGQESSGGDFYSPFWSDAKDHVFGLADLHQMVDERIGLNSRRGRLYPLLRDGFLLWWNERRRWTNEPFQPGQSLRAHFEFPRLDATVKIESVLSVRDDLAAEHIMYPYFAPDPVLSDHAARLGLWLLTTALPAVNPEEIRILDVIRGQTFSLDRNPLDGSEESEFRRRYSAALREREALLEEYD